MGPSFSQDALHISVSQIKTFLRCSRQFELKYIRRAAPEFIPVPLAFGSSFHAVLAFLYSELKNTGAVASLEQLQQLFEDTWSAVLSGDVPLQADDDDARQDDVIAKAHEMLATFREHVVSSPPARVEMVEMPFEVELHDPRGEVLEERLVGVFDLVLAEGKHRHVVEHKSSSRKFSTDQLLYDLQPTAYAYAAQQLGWGEVGLTFQVTTKTKVPALQIEHIRRDERDIDDFLGTAAGVLKSIDAGVSFPVRGWACRSCPYQRHCRDSRR